MLTHLRDYRSPRDWKRPWLDPPGFFTGQAGCFCCQGSANAYHLGGDTSGFGAVTAAAYRTVFSTDVTTAITGANLSQARRTSGAFANPSTAGYVLGGATTTSARVVTADKLTFSGETTAAATTADLPTAQYGMAALSERSTKGYVLGGFTTARTVDAYKTVFSTDATSASTASNLSVARTLQTGLTEGTTKGYIGGGNTGVVAYTAVSDLITFSTDGTAAATTANLTSARDGYFSMSDGSTKGYWAGGNTGAAALTCDKVTFSTDVCAVQTSANFQRYAGSASSNGTYGYATAGISSVAQVKTTEKFTFSTDLHSAVGAGGDIATATAYLCGFSTAAL